MLLRPIAGGLCLLGIAAAGAAEVTARGPTGFVSEHELVLAATPQRAYQALTEQIHLWWDASHSYSGRAENLYLEARAMGCFCERLPDGGSVAHMRVLFAQPGVLLRLGGGLGPLQGVGAGGSMDFRLTAVEGGTRLSYRYAVTGFDPAGMARWADPVDRVQLDQLMRLQRFLQ